jgi:uncharacterized damage-inducible protein DinB
MLAKQVETMAAYNRWMNDKLYAVCAELTDEERKLDRRSFFGSIHATLNHLLLADRVWFGRFIGRPFKAQRLNQELYADFTELNAQRAAMDREIEDWARGLTDTVLATKLEYMSLVNPAPQSYDLWVCVTHFFNHQTHHRGQVTALLSQCGRDYGVTDLVWLPELRQNSPR